MRLFGRVAAVPFAAAALVLSGAARANADTITFTGGSSGCFNCTSGGSTTALVGGLTFDASTFTGLTADASGSALIDLGTMALDWSSYNYSRNHTTFLLNVTFTAPASLSGSYDAQIQGSVNLLGNGSVNIQLDKSYRTFTFSNDAGYGSFDFGMLDPSLHLQSGQSLNLWGAISALQYTATVPSGGTGSETDGPDPDPLPPTDTGSTGGDPVRPVPEPASLVLFGGSLAAVIGRRLRRQRP